MPLSETALVVLAGGRGLRMGGVVKGLLTLPNGEIVLARMLEDLGPCVSQVAVVAPVELHARLAAAAPSAALVDDPGLGPAHAMIRAAQTSTVEWLWVVAADLPGLRPEHLAWLVAGLGASRDAVIPVLAGRPQPLVALYRRVALAARAPPADGAVRTLVAQLAPVELSADALPAELAAGLKGFNTWAEAARWGIFRPAGLANEPGPRG